LVHNAASYAAYQQRKISKDVGIHSLLHSFATHLLERGVDIRYIKDLPGHFNSKTTERYLHITRERLVNIISPLDNLWRSGFLFFLPARPVVIFFKNILAQF